MVVDLGLQQYIPVDEARFWKRREHIYEIYRSLLSVDCVILTLGLIEQWYYNAVAIQHSPNNRHMIKEKSFFDFEVISHEDVEFSLLRIVKILKVLNNNIKVIFTVSPVPLEKTFTKDHVYVANYKSKSTLLSAVSRVVEAGKVDYFPSYEIVSLLGEEAFEKDRRHVKGGAVSLVCDEFLRAYLK